MGKQRAADAQRQFADLIGPHVEPIRSYLARRVSRDDVDDLLQTVCEIAWRRRQDIPEDAPLLWLYGVARNVVRNFHRTNARRDGILTRYLPFLAQPVEQEPLLTRTGDDRMDAALAALSEDDRDLLRLWAWEALDYREIAVLLGLSESAAASRLTRARNRLGEALTGLVER
jgi:RNA polymerase sigma-70 factor (ECF subfamily)